MSNQIWRTETQLALRVADQALALIRSRSGADTVTSKGGRDLVTDTDIAVEDLIRTELFAQLPSYAVVGEERGGSPTADGAPYWLVDPICGTRNFASDVPLYCVNLALVEAGQVTLGVVGDGATATRYVAERNRGAWMLRGDLAERIRVSEASDTIVVDTGAASGEILALSAEFYREVTLDDRWFVRTVGTSLFLPWVSQGAVSASVSLHISSPVHVAAGALLALEAGAVVTDLTGQPWTVAAPSLITAASSTLHGDLLTLLARSKR